MITEDYVSFETAKLLKEKGFDECPLFHYDDCGQIWIPGGYDKTKTWHFPAPTLQMAMKWLREVHDLNINNELSIHGYFCSISHIVRDSLGNIVDIEDSESWETAYYDTHEDACEAAIRYCLENLI